ncbi:homoserine kinase [Catalinimonas alkaloidigena]|uniref:Homoserine kinase n=1 Tax=Catalinimonas alkaloidigena TaxID=1075417 RepID=A0A1G9T0X0_9BACT|nr:homoserine kinase [Catalinimonas alkaloidigena]SDM41292.1 homoserine kinase [Catalinimonas alkaloidigena]
MEWIKVFAPATIGNIGPGFDVLGLSVKYVGDTLEARKIEEGIVISEIESDMPLSTDPEKNTAGIAAAEVLKILNITGGVELKIKKGMPSGSGLGSSAASAAAAAFATNYLYGDQLTREELILPATRAEAFVSGAFFADNTAPCLLGGATLTRSCMPLDVTKIGSISNLLIVLVTPDIVVLTKEARDILPTQVDMKDFIYNMANSCLITAAFAKDDYGLFARSLNDAIVEPARSKLIAGYDDVKANALRAGADGVAISGSGPTVFAITNDPRKVRFIQDAMVRTFRMHGVESTSVITEVDNDGTRLVDEES